MATSGRDGIDLSLPASGPSLLGSDALTAICVLLVLLGLACCVAPLLTAPKKAVCTGTAGEHVHPHHRESHSHSHPE
jgi:hypothetical protein